MNKKESEELTNNMYIADTLLRIKALTQLLITKGVITSDELDSEMNAIVESVAKDILSKTKQ